MKLHFLNCAKISARAILCTLFLTLTGMLAGTSASAQTVLYAEGADMANTGDGITYNITTPGTYRWTGTLTTPDDFQDRFSINLGGSVQISSASYTISGPGGFNGLYGFYANSAGISGNGSGAMSSGIGFPMLPIGSGPFYNNIFIGASFSAGNTWIIDVVVTAYCTTPSVAIGMSPAGTLCTGSSKTLTASGATTYTWAPATGLSATTGATVTASPTSTTTYTVIGTTGSCTNTATRTVTVASSPTVTTTLSPTGAMCPGDTKTITASGATSYTWAPATGLSATTGASVTASPTVTTTYTVTGTTTGCSDDATRTINVTPRPVITSISSLIGIPGNTRTITGTGFNGTNANNIVYFGATRATVTGSTTTSLTATVPVGATYKQISLNNQNCNLTGYTQYPFLPTYNNSAFVPGTVNFATQVRFNTSVGPYMVVTGDIDGDGKPDLVVANSGSNSVSVYRNTSSAGSLDLGSFAPPVSFTTGSTPPSAAIGDIDGDGKPDLVVTNSASNTVSVFRNTSSSGSITSGSFATQVTFATGADPFCVAIGDIDGDGKPELAVANRASNTVSIYRNTSSSGSISTGSFDPQVTFATGNTPFHLAIGDVDGDGKPDLAVANRVSNSVSVLHNTSSSGSISAGSFATQVTFATGSNPICVAIGDIDGDGKPDLVVANRNSNNVAVLRNTSSSGSITSGSFAAQVTFATGTDPWSLAIGDIDGDGKPDLAVANITSGDVSVLRNTSSSGSITSGSFVTHVPFGTDAGPLSVAIGDLDGDGKPDLAVANNYSDGVSVIRNNPISPITGTQSVCISATTTLSNAATGGTWSSSNTAIATVGSSTGVVTGVASGTATITYAGTAGASFAGNRVTAIVTVNVVPTVTTTMTPTGNLCLGSSKTLTAGGATTYTWAPATGLSATTGASVTASPTATTIYTVTGTTSGCSDNATRTITVTNPPVITSVSSLIGIPGNTRTITGTGFNGTNANNIVFFGATRATVTGSTTTSLTATVPVGATYKEISLNNQNCDLTGYAQYPFLPTYNNSAFAPATVNFATQVQFTSDTTSLGVAIGDLDGDGKPDMAVTNTSSNSISVYRNTSSSGSITTGSFATQVTFASETSPTSVTIADIDGDGKPDMAVTNRGSNTVSVYRNTSSSGSITSGSFATQVTFATGANPRKSAIGDIDGDGKPDMAVTNYNDATVSIYRNTSSSGSLTAGSFAPPVTFATGTNPSSVAIGDIDGDGKADMAVTNAASNNVSVYRNTSSSGSINSSSFATQVTFTSGTQPTSLAIGDIDGDGKPEIATANTTSGNVSVFLNSSISGTISSGSFASPVTFTTGSSSRNLAIGDIDGDGKPDMVVTNFGSNTASVLRNTSSSGSITSGSFATQVTFATGSSPRNLAIGDIDGDGKPDMVVANDNLVSVIRNNPLSPITGTQSVCISATTTLSNTTTGGTWSSSNTAIATVGSSTGVVTGVASGTATITYAGTAGASFAGNRVTTTVTVNALPTISAGAGVAICRGSNTTLTATGGTTYTWSPNTALSATTGASVTASPTTTVTYTATGTNASGCSNTATKTVSVNPLPTISAGAGVAICRGSSTSITATGGATYTWAPGTALSATTGASVTASPTTTVTYTVTGTDGNGCVNTATKVVTVNVVPTVTTTMTPTGNLCLGSSKTLTAGGGTTYTWAPATGLSATTGATVTASPTTTTTYTVTGTTTGCSDDATRTITITNPPVITSVSSLVGIPGNTRTITGTGFNGTNANNIVYFGATRATVTAATTTSLTATIPVGATYKEISLNNQNCDLTGYAQYPFLPTYNNSAFAAGTVNFETRIDSFTGAAPYCVTIGDIDGDGKADMAVANSNSASVSVFRNTGSSGTVAFASKVDFTAGTSPRNIAIGDLDGDGKPDMVVVNYVSNTISVFRNTSTSGTVSFDTRVDLAAGVGPRTVAIGDLDGDGRADIAVTNGNSANFYAYRNTGASGTVSFASPVSFATGSLPYGIAIGDIDGNGIPDVVVANHGSNNISVFRNTGTAGAINFAAGVTSATGAYPTIVRIGDIDGNGVPDIAVSNYVSSSISVFRNLSTSGAISLAGHVTFATQTNPLSVAIGDLDGDGKLDMVGANDEGDRVSVLRNTSTSGTVSFASRVDFASNNAPFSVEIGDLDGDNKPDIAVANQLANRVSVLRNDPLSPVTGTVTTCVGGTTTLANVTTGGTWSSSTTAVATVGSLTGVVTGVAIGTAVITYAGTAISGFTGNYVTTTVTIGALPTISAGAGVAICNGSGTTLIATGGTTYTWAPNTALSATTGASVTASPTTTVTYTVNGTNAGGCSNTATKTVSVNPLPTIDAGAGVAICRGSSTAITATGGATYTWAPNTALSATTGASITASPTTTVTYTVTGTDANGCVNTDTKTVTVNVVPTVTTTMTPTGNLCLGSSKTLTAGGATTYTWAPATGLSATTGASVTASPTATTIYTVTGTTSGCSDDATRTITITNPPEITSVSTLVGIPGTAVSLTGTGFNGTNANNIVYFGATRATVTGSTTTSLTATVPVGATYAPVTLNNQNCGLTGYSRYQFLPTYNNSSYAPGTFNFNTSTDIASGGLGTNYLTVGDYDGDGKPDAAVLNSTSLLLSVFRNTSTIGSVSYSSVASYSVNAAPNGLQTVDVDGDGKLDLIVFNYNITTDNQLKIYRNTSTVGSISFATPYTYSIGAGEAIAGIALGDLDSDGKPDIVLSTQTYNKIYAYKNLSTPGSISFTFSLFLTGGGNPNGLQIHDLNVDGKPEIIFINGGGNLLCVYPNTSTSGGMTFGTRIDRATNSTPRNIKIGDLDGDGAADIVVSTNGSPNVSVYRNTSSGSVSIASKVDYATGTQPFGLALSDVDGDGKAELLVGSIASNILSVFPNNSTSGTITLGTRTDFATNSGPGQMEAVDVDGDGKNDIAIITSGTIISVFRNNPLAPITGTLSACAGSTSALSNATTGGIWSSSNTTIATVGSLTGVVTGVAAGTATITYAGTAGASFIGNVVTTTLTINAQPTVSAGANVAICRGSNTTLTATGGTTYTWSPNTALSATTGASVTASPTTTVTYTVTGTNASGCSNTATKTVSVNPLPTIDAGAGVAICRGSSTAITATGGATYTWAPGTALSATTGASVTASPTTTVTYTVTGTDANGCVNTATNAVTVNAVPTITPGSAATICSGATAALSASGASTYTWSPAADLSASTGANVTASPTITTTYTVTGTNTLGCSNTATQLVTVNELPDAFTGSTILCAGTTSTLSSAPGGGVWTSSNNAIATVGTSSGLVSGIAAGTSSITYTLGTGCRRKVTVTVNAAPTISAGTGVAICSSNSTSLTATGGLTYSWSPAAALSATTGASVTASPTTTVTYTVTGTNANGCVNTATKTVTVNALPTISAGTQLNLCIGQFSAISATGGTTYTWSPGTGLSATTGASVTASPTTTVTYTVTGTNANGCTNFATKLVSVNPLPTVSAGANVAICRGSSTTLSATGTGSTYTWGPNIGLSAIAGASVTASPTVTITYTVTAMHSNGCTNLATKTVSVNALPTITAGAGVAICQGSSTAMTASGGVTYTWAPGTALTATTGASVTASPTTTVTYTVSGTNANGCVNTATKTVTVNASPTIVAGANATICRGASTALTASGGTTYTWAPNTALSATTGASVTASPTTTVTYTVTGTNGCVGTATQTVSVNPLPTIGAGATVTICRNSSATLTATGGATYTWSPATALDATTGTSVTASPTTTVTYTVTGTDANGCTNTATKMVSVNALPTITAGADVAICSGNSTTMTASGGVTYTWAPGTALTATTGASVTASPTTTVTYTVSGTNANGCVNTATKTVTVNASPTIVAGADATICRGASTALTASGGTTYTWAPNTALSATTGASVTASPTTTVTYTVTGSNGCVGTATQTVSVNPLPTISAGAGVAICNGASTTLNATGGDTYLWSPGTSLSATTGGSVVATPTITTTYTVSGTDANGCENTATTTVSVNASPTISAGADTAICTGSSATITATGATTFTWTPAAGLSATTGASATASPTTTTTYTVTGTIAGGCNSTATKTVTVNALPTISAGSDVAICQGTGTTLSATGGTTYTWSPNTALSATTGISVTASPTTTVTYTVTGTDANGCNNAASKQVSVNVLPTINAGSGVVICTGASTTLSATGGTTYTWSPGTSLSATSGTSVTASPTTTVTYTVTGTDGNGCTNTATTIVSVDVTPDAGTISGEDLVSIGAATALSSTQVGGTWSAGNGNATVGSTTGIVTGVSGGTVVISYTYTNACGTDYASKTMTVNSASSIISGSSQLCVNSTTTYLPPLPGGTWSSSNPAVISINAATGVASGMGFGTATISYTLGTTFYTKNVTVSNTTPAITGSLVACHGLTTVLSHSIEGGIWSSGSPWHATINSANGTVMAVTPGVSLISYTLGTDCHAISVFTVTPLPGAISGSLEICQGNSLALYSSTFSGTWVSTTASVATIGSATGIATGISTGTSSITYTGPNGCITTAIVTVNAPIGSIIGTPSVCVGGTNSTLVSPVSGGTWSSSNTGIVNVNATTGLLTGIAIGNANISYTTTPGCYTVVVATVNILDTITGANNVCSGATITLTNGTGGGVWSSSNVSKATVGAATGSVTGISPGSAIITYTLGSCYRTRTVSVTPAPAAITGTTTLCIGTSATLSSATSGGVWSSSDITKATVNSTTGLTTGIATGTAVISYTAGGCSSTVIVTVGTLAAISGSASVCVSSTTTFTHVTTGGVWSSSNTSRATIGAGTGIATGVSAGTVRISYTVGGACSQTIIVTVNALPNNITGNATVCEGAITTLATTTAAGTWSSSTPAIATVGTNGVVTGVTAGTTTISYQLSTGCAKSRVVTVNMTPDIITGTTSVCIGSTTTLASATGGGVWASYFTSRATINAATGVATGISAGTTIISYTLGTCRRTTVLTVAPTPAAITGILIICNGSNTALSSATTGGVWSSSDVTKATINAATGLVTGVGTGTSIISYIVGGCSRSAIVTVNASIGAISGDGLVCVGQTNATLTGPGGSGTWSSSNTAVATAHAVTGLLTGVSPGTATITYTSSATCVATIVATVNAAVNNITGTLAICDGTSTTLSNATADGTWSSSNTTKASVNAATGLVSGVSAGTTTISYRVSAGCYKATTFYINPLPPNINGSATVVIGGSTTFTSMTGGTWTSNNGTIATVGAGTGVVSGISLGATTITYSLATGCFRTKGISVVPARPDNDNYTTIETTAILKIYPNPTSGVLTIEAPSNGTFAVYAIDGKHLADYQITIPSSIVTLPRELAAGVYMCRYTAADGSTTIVRIVYEP